MNRSKKLAPSHPSTPSKSPHTPTNPPPLLTSQQQLPKPKDKLDDKLSATSFFAKLREKMQGPMPKKRSPSPEPVIFIPEDAQSQSSITEIIIDGSPTVISPQASCDAIDGDKSRICMVIPAESNGQIRNFSSIPSAGSNTDGSMADVSSMNGTGLMHLPFPPGVDRNDVNAKPLVPTITVNNVNIKANFNFNTNSQDGSGFQLDSSSKLVPKVRNKNVSITKDLPMPPGNLVCYVIS